MIGKSVIPSNSLSAIMILVGVVIIISIFTIFLAPGKWKIFGIIIFLVATVIGIPIILVYGIASIPSDVGDDSDWLGFWGSYIGSLIGVFGSGITAYLIFNYQQKEIDKKKYNQEKKQEIPTILDVNAAYDLIGYKERNSFLTFEYAIYPIIDSAEYDFLQDVAEISTHHIVKQQKKYSRIQGIVFDSKVQTTYYNVKMVVSFENSTMKAFSIGKIKSNELLVLDFEVYDDENKVNSKVSEYDIIFKTKFDKVWMSKDKNGTVSTFLINENENKVNISFESSDKKQKNDKNLVNKYMSVLKEYEKLEENKSANFNRFKRELIISVM